MTNKILVALSLAGIVTLVTLDAVHHPFDPVFTGEVPIYTKTGEYRYEITPLPDRIRWCKKSYTCSYLAKAIVYEARGESSIGRYAVAYVILNRTKHSRFPDTIVGVLRQKKQFSYQDDYWKQQKPSKQDWDNAYAVGYDVLNGEVDDPSAGSVYYHSTNVAPRWARSMEYAMTIDNHIFYREIGK